MRRALRHRRPCPARPGIGPGSARAASGSSSPRFPRSAPTLPSSAPRPGGACAGGPKPAGAGALWACDHLFWHGPALEALSRPGRGAGRHHPRRRHRDVRLATAAAPRAHPWPRRRPSLAHLSGGRLVLGVGVGSHRGEYAAAGRRLRRPGAGASTTAIDTLRRAWAVSPRRALRATAGGPDRSRCGSAGRVRPRCAARRAGATGGSRCSCPPTSTPPPWAASTRRPNGRDAIPGTVARAMVAFVSVGGCAVPKNEACRGWLRCTGSRPTPSSVTS